MPEDLEIFSGPYPNSKTISLFVIMVTLMFVAEKAISFLPLPVSILFLYIFRSYKSLAGKAFLVNFTIKYIILLMMWGILVFPIIAFDTVSNASIFFTCKLSDYSFSTRAIFGIGISLQLPVLPFAAGLILSADIIALNDIFLTIIALISSIAIGVIVSGLMTFVGFKTVLKNINKSYNIDSLELII